MSKTVLFTPVGGTDPISQSNLHDGSMIHIMRWYKPDEVYLYMSNEIIEKHNSDNRYMYCIQKLEERIGKPFDVHTIFKEDLKEVQDYDFFFEEFRKELESIIGTLDSSDRLILNIASGTPAMKSALLVLATMVDLDCICVQVLTPGRSMNEHTQKDYDVELLWEANEDNEEGAENRCREVISHNLLVLRTEESIKSLIRRYDYHSAIALCNVLPEYRAEKYRKALKMAESRLALNLVEARLSAKELGLSILPVNAEPQCETFEYALQLDIKQKKGDYADFLRALTPIIFALFERLLEFQCGFKAADYIKEDNYGVPRWDEQALSGTQALTILRNAYNGDFRYGTVSGDNYEKLIKNLAPVQTELVTLVSDLRRIERKVRNKAAHEIGMFNREKIKKLTGYYPEEIMALVRKAFKFTGYNIKEEYWDSYDEMNRMIMELL